MIESQTHHQGPWFSPCAALQPQPQSGDADILQALFAKAVFTSVFNRKLSGSVVTPRILPPATAGFLNQTPQATARSSRKLQEAPLHPPAH